MAAGCEVVISNLGALYETCAPFGTFVGFDKNFKNLEKKYQKTLLNSIKIIGTKKINKNLIYNVK